MTNEQLTQELMNLKERQIKSIAEHEKFELILKELQDDIKQTKSLAEDVHIMAINMANMQKTLEQTNKKVDELSSKDFNDYKENKKIVKQSVLSNITSSIVGFVVAVIIFIILLFIQGGK